MANANLIPKSITDKNGVQTTRWVKPDAGGKSASRIPGPTAVSKKELKTPNVDLLFGQSPLSYSTMTVKDLNQDALATMEELLTRAIEGDQFGSPATNMRALVSAALKNISENGHEDQSAFNNVAALGESIAFSGSRTDSTIDVYLNGIWDRFPGVDDFYTDASEEQVAQARALCRLTASLPYKYLEEHMGYDEFDPDDNIEDHVEDDPALYYTKIHPDHKDLVDFVMERPDRVDEIIRIIRERDSVDVGMLSQVLDHEQAALKEGTL